VTDREISAQISAALLRLRARAPFFSALCLFARFVPREDIPTAATDGRDVFYNPDWLGALDRSQREGVLLHEVLHAALLHPSRRGAREPVRWNVAADVVVNGIVESQGLPLAPGAVRDPKLADRSVEEIYALLEDRACPSCGCLLPASGGVGRLAETAAHWKQALRQAAALARSHGDLPAGIARLVDEATSPKLNWRTRLWRFLVRHPSDFSGFDRRHLWRGLYLEELTGDRLAVHVAVDTSGSIGPQELSAFLGEVRGIARAYPHLDGRLYYADAALDGPHPLLRSGALASPVGGGGTDFRPFFAAISGETEGVCVYLTDGYGSFPEAAPRIATLWVVVPGGLADTGFSFGEVVRLLEV